MTMLTEYERQQLKAIEAWKVEEPGRLRRALGILVAPVDWVLQLIVPEAAIRAAIDGASELGQLMTDTEDILTAAQVSEVAGLRNKDLGLSDRLADRVHNWAVSVAMVEGSVAGAFGVVSVPLELPAIVTIAMRTIHKIGVCYGYESKTEDDQRFCRGVLAAAGATTLEEKVTALGLLTALRVVLVKQTWKALVLGIAQRKVTTGVATAIAYDFARQVGISLMKRRMLAAIPVAGALVGAAASGQFINDVAWAARRSFQERWLADAGKLTPADDGQDAESEEQASS